VLGKCNGCGGSKMSTCHGCLQNPLHGKPRPVCNDCLQSNETKYRAKHSSQGFQKKPDGPPKKGVSISKCAAGDLSRLQDLWVSREGQEQFVLTTRMDHLDRSAHASLQAIAGARICATHIHASVHTLFELPKMQATLLNELIFMEPKAQRFVKSS